MFVIEYWNLDLRNSLGQWLRSRFYLRCFVYWTVLTLSTDADWARVMWVEQRIVGLNYIYISRDQQNGNNEEEIVLFLYTCYQVRVDLYTLLSTVDALINWSVYRERERYQERQKMRKYIYTRERYFSQWTASTIPISGFIHFLSLSLFLFFLFPFTCMWATSRLTFLPVMFIYFIFFIVQLRVNYFHVHVIGMYTFTFDVIVFQFLKSQFYFFYFSLIFFFSLNYFVGVENFFF